MKRNLIILENEYLVSDILEFYLNFNTSGYIIKKIITIEELLEFMKTQIVDTLLLSTNLGLHDIGLKIKNIIILQPKIKIILLTKRNEISIIDRYNKSSIYGCVNKSTFNCKDLNECLLLVLAGKKYFKIGSINEDSFGFENKLTSSETKIYYMLKNGLSIKLIAEELNIAINTVNNHKKNIYKKLNIHSIKELILL